MGSGVEVGEGMGVKVGVKVSVGGTAVSVAVGIGVVVSVPGVLGGTLLRQPANSAEQVHITIHPQGGNLGIDGLYMPIRTKRCTV
jgi:hypothetical protein